ncbi:MAG TPA: hypothetical protein VHD62_13145 [Opitutaceae bacterium]|nr:hypothetical protein [Opitutaceae bacterium]
MVSLPPFLVEETLNGRKWRYAELPGVEVLSRCADDITSRLIETQERVHRLFALLVPPSLQLDLSTPHALIFYDDDIQPETQAMLERLLRSSAAESPAEPARSRSAASPPRTSAKFLPNLWLADRDAFTVFSIVRDDNLEADRLALSQDYVSYLLVNRTPALPTWFTAGILMLYENTALERGELTIGRLAWPDDLRSSSTENAEAPAALQPLAAFFAGELPPRRGAIDGPHRWQWQAALFVRWALDGKDAPRRAALWRFAERAAQTTVTEALFRECFGLGYATALDQMEEYLPGATKHFLTLRLTGAAAPPPFQLRDATFVEVARIKGDWERMEVNYLRSHYPQLAPKYLEQAQRTLAHAYERGTRDPRLLAVTGLCDVDANNNVAARDHLEAAAREGELRPRAWFELARLRFAALSDSATGNEKLSATQVASVLQPLFKARALHPPLPEVYELIADVWTRSAAAPTRLHLAVLDEGVRLFPHRDQLVLHAAELNAQHGFPDAASVLVDVGLRFARDAAVREKLAALRQRLDGTR